VGYHFSVTPLQFRLRFKQVHLTCAAVLKQHDDGLGLRREMAKPGRQIVRTSVVCGCLRPVRFEKTGQGESAETEARILQEFAAGW
jgi:hypothetical protein